MTLDSHIFWMTVASVGLGIGINIWQRAENYINGRKISRLAGGRFDTKETSDMSEPKEHHSHTIVAAGAVPIFCGGCDCEVDPGIAPLVALLKENGFVTTDSGDGRSKPPEERSFEFPHVFVMTKKEVLITETERLYQLLQSQGITGFTVEGNYGPADGVSLIMVLGKDEAELAQAIGEVTAPVEPAAVAPEPEAPSESAAIEGYPNTLKS